ncbi:unnamed protein product [Brugia timori]|uniref:Secreted protein n=1 Tax=Brugia timori TaxID=42155 RepID=A0A0R3QLW1_9BILA|nr:unnamed protein product [Brugia timori]
MLPYVFFISFILCNCGILLSQDVLCVLLESICTLSVVMSYRWTQCSIFKFIFILKQNSFCLKNVVRYCHRNENSSYVC